MLISETVLGWRASVEKLTNAILEFCLTWDHLLRDRTCSGLGPSLGVVCLRLPGSDSSQRMDVLDRRGAALGITNLRANRENPSCFGLPGVREGTLKHTLLWLSFKMPAEEQTHPFWCALRLTLVQSTR